MPATYNILIMGASYGSLLASKLLFSGHQVKLVCLPAEADLINAEGFRVRVVPARTETGCVAGPACQLVAASVGTFATIASKTSAPKTRLFIG